MLISREWLGDFVALPLDLDADTLAHDLTIHAVEVEGHTAPGRAFDGRWVVGVVRDVDDARGRWLVDVGATEPVAIDGAGAAPEGPTIVDLGRDRACSPADICLAEMYPGHGTAPLADPDLAGVAPGTSAALALGLDDTVFEIDNKSLTNRPDLWGHLGIARELAAIYGLNLTDPPSAPLNPATADPSVIGSVDAAVALRFAIVTIRPGVGSLSPLEVRSRLHRVGQRSLGLYADLTNYVMFAVGQPSHAYDAARVALPLSVRRGPAGSLAVLSGGVVEVTDATGVIADDDDTVAIAGIVGGSSSQVMSSTASVALEMGNFVATAVRRTSIDLGVRTDASARFEKDLDTQSVDRGLGYLIHLIATHDPGAEITAHADQVTDETVPSVVATTLSFINTRMGTDLTAAEVADRLAPLGFSTTTELDGAMAVSAPTWRSTGDISIPNDVLEEVARSIGYDELPPTTMSVDLRRSTHHGTVALERRVREHLALPLQAQEVLTYPWALDELLSRTGFDLDARLRIDGAPSVDRQRLRPSLIPNLLGAVEVNLPNRARFRLFEVGSVYLGDASEPRVERRVGAAFVGSDVMEELRTVVGGVEAMTRFARVADLRVVDAAPDGWGDAAVRRDIVANGERIGRIAALDLGLAIGGHGIGRVAVFFEMVLDGLRTLPSRDNRFVPVSAHPSATVDLSVWVPEDVRWADVEAACAVAEVPHLRQVRFVDEFRDDEGRRSLTLRLHLSSPVRTLLGEDKAVAWQTLLDLLRADLGADARG